jgi:tetratricopeptide (TPR) repeat protein
MKKNKNASTPDTQSSSSHQRLHVVLFTAEKEINIDSVSEAVQRSKQNVLLHIVGNAHQSASLNTLAEKGQAKFYDSLPTIELSENSYVWLADGWNHSYTESVIQYFYTSKKQFASEAIYVGETNEQTGKSGFSIVDKIINTLYNIVGQMLMPHGQKNFLYPYTFTAASLWNEVANTGTTNTQLLLSAAAYRNKKILHIPVGAKETKNHYRSLKMLFGNAWLARINWFVKDALCKKTNQQRGIHGPWRTAFLGITILSLFVLPILSQHFGMTWDERRHNDYSKHTLSYFTTMGEDTTSLLPNLPTQEFRYYGEHFNVIAAFLYTYVMPIGEYETRHFLNAIYAFFAMLFAALIAKELAGWRAGTIAWVLIVLSPVFFAQGMNNPTDIPFATGFAIAIYYLFKIYKSMPTPKTSHIIFVAVGIGIAVGSRVGGILLYAYAAMFMGIHWLILIKKEGLSPTLGKVMQYAKVFLILLAVGHLLSISLWPFGQQSVLTSWYEAFKQSTEGAFFTYNHELFEGNKIYMANVPWYYLPKFIAINSPLAVLVGVILFFVGLLQLRKAQQDIVLLLFLLFTVLFPIVYAEFKSLYYYNGWRHYLFIYPSIIALSAVGWEAIARTTTRYVALAPILASLVPLTWMIQNHPHQTVYFNELVGGTKGAYGKYELDYYSNSCREAGEWIANQHPNDSLLVGINNEPLTASYYAHKINPKLRFQWMREYEEQKLAWDYAIITTRTHSSNELLNGSFPPKGTVHVIEVAGAPICAIVKRENHHMPNGYDAINRKDFDSAVWYFTQATLHNELDEEAWRMLGSAYNNKREADSALFALQRSVEIYPENFTAYNEIGLVYANIKGDLGKAITYFDKAISHKINYSDPYYYAAALFLNKRDFYGAINYLERGIKYGGKSVAEFHYNLAFAYLNTNSTKKAEEYVINAITLNNNFAQAYQLLAQIYQAQGRQADANQIKQQYKQFFN